MTVKNSLILPKEHLSQTLGKKTSKLIVKKCVFLMQKHHHLCKMTILPRALELGQKMV